MYFLGREDLALLHRRLGQEARVQPVVEDLRGWRWDRPPLSPVFEPMLTVEEVASAECPSGRDVYLSRVLGVRSPEPVEAIEERALRAAVAACVTQAKRLIYLHGAEAAALVPDLTPPSLGLLLYAEVPVPPGLAERVGSLWSWECSRIAARVRETAAAFPGVGSDALAALALPVTVGQRVDGRFLALAADLEVDGLVSHPRVVVLLRFGEERLGDRLATAGLALALEAAWECPVDFGCVVEAGFADGRPVVRRQLYVIDDELRQRFIEARDEKARLVQEEIDPGPIGGCGEGCPRWTVCHGWRL